MKSKMYLGLIEILKKISADRSWNDDAVNGHISWLKENIHIREGIEMDKRNEKEFQNREAQIRAYIENYIANSGLNGKMLQVEYEKLIGRRGRSADKKPEIKKKEHER